MNKFKNEVERIFSIYDSNDKSIDFAIYLNELEKTNKELYDAILEEYNKGKSQARYLKANTGSNPSNTNTNIQ